MMANVVLIAMVMGLGAAIYFGVTATSDLEDAGDAYVAALQRQDYVAAYEMLAPETKAKVSMDAFQSSMYTPLIAKSTSHAWNRSSAGTTNEGCLLGAMVADGKPESLWLYMWRNGDTWTVHTVASENLTMKRPWQCRR